VLKYIVFLKYINVDMLKKFLIYFKSSKSICLFVHFKITVFVLCILRSKE